MCLVSLALVAGCNATPHTTGKSAPTSALECRQEVRDTPRTGASVIATGGGLSGGESLAIALITGAISGAVARDANSERLNDCYDAVGAAPADRLPLSTATTRHDEILAAGGSKAEARRIIVKSVRGGPNGGAGFSYF